MTLEKMKQVAEDHGFGVKVLDNGSASLTDALGELTGWNLINQLSGNEGYCFSDLRYALGY